MRVIIGIATSILLISCLCLLVLPLTLTIFLVITAGSFIAFHLSHNPTDVSRALGHVRFASASAPKFWASRPEEETARRTTAKASVNFSPIYQTKLTDSVKERGKENIGNYVRPILKPRRFRNTVETSEYGKSPTDMTEQRQSHRQNWFPLKNSTAANFSTWSPRPATEGTNFSTDYTFDDKLSFSRLPLSPIYPPNKSIDSPDLNLSSTTMLRFNSGQDSLLHPSMHYPTHQPDLVTSPGLLPSVSWLKDGGGMSSPRHRKGLPTVQSPVMVRIASPLPDRPASPLFRKLASESDRQKANSADRVIMAMKLRSKRTAQEADTETSNLFKPSDVRSESKRRKLDSTSGKDVARNDVDMDLDPLPRRKQTDKVSWPSRFGITSPTPRNPIESSFSSSRRSQTALKRKVDTSSIEVEEEEGVSPIKKKVHTPSASQQSPDAQIASKRPSTSRPTPQAAPGASALRSGSRALYLEKNTQSPRKEAGTTPQKSGLKGKLFTPKRNSFVPRVDTPGEYTAADNKEDRAQARQRGSYLKEMLMQETEENTSKGADSTPSAPTANTLFTGAATVTTTTASAVLPTLSLGITKSTASTTSSAPSAISATASSSSGGMPALGVFSTSAQKTTDNPLLSASDKQKLTATSSEKTVKFGNPTAPQLNLSSSASAASVGTSQKAGEASVGFKLPSAPSLGNGLPKVQETQPPMTFGTKPLDKSASTTGGTQLDAKAQLLSTNNNAVPPSSTGTGILGKASQSETPSAPISGGFTVGGSAPISGGSSTTTVPASSASTMTSTKPQFPSVFGGLGAASGAQKSVGTTTGTPSSQTKAGGFQFGQTLGGSTSTTAGGLTFGTPKTSSVPSGLATPFQAAAHTSTASTTNKPMFSMTAPATTAPSSTQSGGPQFPPIFGQHAAAKPAEATGLGQGTPSFGSTTSQPASGGFTFGQSAPSATSAAAPQAFTFGSSSTAAPTSSTSSTSSIFGPGQPAPSFGASKPATAAGSSIFGSTPAPNQTPLGSANTSTSTMFGGATATPQNPSFGATGSTTSLFGSGSTPAGATSASKPTFGNPTATVTPFGSGISQPAAAAAATASPFQFGASQPKPPTQSSAAGGFNFGTQGTPQKNVSFGTSAPSTNNGFQFGQTQPSGGAAQQTNFFGGAAANTASPFGGGGGFGNPAPSSGATPGLAFGASPSPAAAPAAGGFSIGAGGTNPASNQRRMSRLRQVRNRSGRR